MKLKIFFYLMIFCTLGISGDNPEIDLFDYIYYGDIKSSWYGPGFHGRTTASGEIYNQHALTAAHKKFKFGTLLRLTNPVNEKSVIVRVNDRGPYIRGRELDVSKAAAIELGMLQAGTAILRIEIIIFNLENFPIVIPQ